MRVLQNFTLVMGWCVNLHNVLFKLYLTSVCQNLELKKPTAVKVALTDMGLAAYIVTIPLMQLYTRPVHLNKTVQL